MSTLHCNFFGLIHDMFPCSLLIQYLMATYYYNITYLVNPLFQGISIASNFSLETMLNEDACR